MVSEWIKLGDFTMFDELPKVPNNEVLAWDGRGGYLVGIIEGVHDGNSRDGVYFTCESDTACLSYVSHYAIITPPNI